MSTSIRALFDSCFHALRSICSRLESGRISDTESLQLSRWQDELGRLRLWAANVGVHWAGQDEGDVEVHGGDLRGAGGSSLEYRLKDSSHIREQVKSLLLDLGQMFDEVEDGIVSEMFREFEDELDSVGDEHASQKEGNISSDDDYDRAEELTQLHSNIVTAINCLFQMSMLIRKPARHDFYMLPQSQEVLAIRPFDQAHVRDKYPEADQTLVERLGLAITLRRHYLRYRKHQGLDVGTEGSAAPSVAISDTFVKSVEPGHINSQDKASASVGSQTSYAPSMLEGGPQIIPSPPKESSGGAPFECPYCLVIISIDGTPAWHKHVFQDLQPYVCTVAACSMPHALFSRRHEWVQHLKEAHPHEWTGDGNRAWAAIDAPDKSSFCAICPLCRSNSESEGHFVGHLARHLQELALFVLPQDGADSDSSDGPDPVLYGQSVSENSVSSIVTTNVENEKSRDEQQGHDIQSKRKSSGTNIDEDEAKIFADEVETRWPEIKRPRMELERQPPSMSREQRFGHFGWSPRPRLNEFFVDGSGIHREVIQREICKFLGPEAYSKPHSHNV